MTELITRSGAWLMQQAATVPDTVYLRAAGRDWFETVTATASGVMSITLVVLTIVVAPAAWDFYKTFQKTRKLLDQVQGDLQPFMRNAAVIAENLNHISTSIRSNMDQVSATIASASHGLNQAMQSTESRINEFNALLQVAQQEAEQAFVSTAAVVHGVRTGAAHFGDGLVPLVEDDDADEGGMDDGDDDEFDADPDEELERTDGARSASARPRLKPRQRRG